VGHLGRGPLSAPAFFGAPVATYKYEASTPPPSYLPLLATFCLYVGISHKLSLFFAEQAVLKMRRSRAHLEDLQLEAETRQTYRGSARISLDVLYFQRDEHRDLDRKHVDYLKGCFQRDKCRRLEKRNHIEAVVDQPRLDAALRSSDVSARELLTNEPNGCPKLSFPAGFKLRCVHGQHRIQAAREFLLPHDKWWTVDLYTSGRCKCPLTRFEVLTSALDLNDSLKQCLHEQHSNEDKPSDGEAYCKIRKYHFQGDTKSEMRWKACLRGCRLKNLKELIADEELTAGFDALLDIPGLWDGMMLTTLQKMMAMGCKDVCNPILLPLVLNFTLGDLALPREH
jgi:hypothetical protein